MSLNCSVCGKGQSHAAVSREEAIELGQQDCKDVTHLDKIISQYPWRNVLTMSDAELAKVDLEVLLEEGVLDLAEELWDELVGARSGSQMRYG